MKGQKLINLQYTTIQNPLPSFIYKDLKRFSREANLYYPNQMRQNINQRREKFVSVLKKADTAMAKAISDLIFPMYGLLLAVKNKQLLSLT